MDKEKQYHLKKKYSFLGVLGWKIRCTPTIVIFVIVPILLSAIICGAALLSGVPTYRMVCGMFAIVIWYYITILLFDLVVVKIQRIYWRLKAILKQRYLPITEEELAENGILTVEDYWKCMESILRVNKNIIFPIINREASAKCCESYNKMFHSNDFYRTHKELFCSSKYHYYMEALDYSLLDYLDAK